MAATTAQKRAFLESAWEEANRLFGGDLRMALRAREDKAVLKNAEGTISSVTGFGQSVSFGGGSGSLSPSQIVDLWRDLIDRFDSAKRYLVWANKYGLDAWISEANGTVGVTALAASSRVLVDTSERWAELVAQYSTATTPLESTQIIGAPVGGPADPDAAIFIWMMEHIVAVYEVRHDFTYLRCHA